MGDPRKQHKKFERPRKLFDKTRIEEENILLKEYGLKNKREVWRVEFKIAKIRGQAKKLINNLQKQEEFINRLKKQGFKVSNIDDVLSLKKEDILERRLQTLLVKKGLAKTPRHARQLITHKHVSVDDKITNIPSFLVPLDIEDKLKIVRIKGEVK